MADEVIFQGAAPATLPAGTKVKTRTLSTGHEIQLMQLDVGTGTSSSPVTSIATETTQVANGAILTANGVLAGAVAETAPASDTASSGLNGRLQRIAQRLTSLIALLPTALGQGTMATSLKVVLPSDQSTLPVAQAATAVVATVTSVPDTASSITLLSLNAARKGYKLFNTSAFVAYVKEGTTASTTDFSYQIQPGGYYEFVGVGCYTGRLDAIWGTNGSGAMLITELA